MVVCVDVAMGRWNRCGQVGRWQVDRWMGVTYVGVQVCSVQMGRWEYDRLIRQVGEGVARM